MVSHRRCNEEVSMETRASAHRRVARLVGAGCSLVALVVGLLLTAGDLSSSHAVSRHRDALLQKLSPSAHLAPAALAAEQLWRTTIGRFFDGQLHPPPPSKAKSYRKETKHDEDQDDVQTALEEAYSPSEDHDPHGMLLPSAAAEQSRWEQQVLSMQRAQLKDNSDIMRNVVLLHASKKGRAGAEKKGGSAEVKRSEAATGAGAARQVSFKLA
ncbi:hypothetical protein GUITHDRAFT_153907, partial [Guillardia theta CCMP2712]